MSRKHDLKLQDEIIEANKSGLDKESWESYKNARCPYTCLRCGNRVGLSFIEPKHDCLNPMFDKSGERLVPRSGGR